VAELLDAIDQHHPAEKMPTTTPDLEVALRALEQALGANQILHVTV
jgi:hypothetical protein